MSQNENFPQALPIGTILAGQYTIESVLGQGGFGITYCATDHKTNQKVAIKEFFPDTLAYRETTKVISYPGERTENYNYGKDGFLDEAKTLAEFIGCDGIVRIYSYFEENETAYFVMEYIDGTSLDSYLKEKGGKISYEEAEKILVPIMESLAVVHSKGIVHRDVTPDNIYLTKDGKVKLLDFGAARYSLGDKSRSLDVILKHGFAPKEQYTRRGKQGPFTDIYSLGATFYFAITGRRPPDSIDRLDEDELIPPSNLGVKLTEYQETAILKALEVQPDNRYQSMVEFRNVLLNDPTFKLTESESVPESHAQHFFTSAEDNISSDSGEIHHTASQSLRTQTQNKPTAVFSSENTAAQNETASSAVKPASKTKLIVAVAAVAVIVIVLVVGIAAKSSKDNTVTEMTVDTVTEMTVDTVTETVNDTPQTSQNTGIIGTGNPKLLDPFGNTQNGGIASIDYDGYFYYIDNCHTIKNGDGITLFECEENHGIDNLIYSKEGLYYIDYTNSYSEESCQIYLYDFESKTSEVVSCLREYTDYTLRMYLSNDYYFVYNNGELHRIQKSTGIKEQSISVNTDRSFALCGNYLYYIGENSDGYGCIYQTSALDFYNPEIFVTLTSKNYSYEKLTASYDNIYAIYECDDYQNADYDFTVTSFTQDGEILIDTTIDLNFFTEDTDLEFDYISGFNAYGNRMVLVAKYNDDSIPYDCQMIRLNFDESTHDFTHAEHYTDYWAPCLFPNSAAESGYEIDCLNNADNNSIEFITW